MRRRTPRCPQCGIMLHPSERACPRCGRGAPRTVGDNASSFSGGTVGKVGGGLTVVMVLLVILSRGVSSYLRMERNNRSQQRAYEALHTQPMDYEAQLKEMVIYRDAYGELYYSPEEYERAGLDGSDVEVVKLFPDK